jgi:transcriptional regulator with XRE-family HTH domain
MQDADLRRKLGARLLAERVQVRDWNESEAAKAAGVAPKTIRSIERGKNYEWGSVEKYASALGRPLAAWLVDVLDVQETRRSAAAAQEIIPAIATGTAGPPFRRHEPHRPTHTARSRTRT